MRIVPQCACEDDFHFLAAGQSGDFVVVGDFRVETEVFEVLRDDFRFELAESKTLPGGFVVVEFLDEFVESKFE